MVNERKIGLMNSARDIIGYVVCCVGAFAKRFMMTNAQAYAYLRRFWQDFGVKERDLILDVDGHRLFDLPRSYFDEAAPGESHSFTIVRNCDTLFIRTGVLTDMFVRHAHSWQPHRKLLRSFFICSDKC